LNYRGILIPFCNNIQEAHAGVKDGFLPIRGQRHFVSLTYKGIGPVYPNVDIYLYCYVYRTLAVKEGKFSASDDLS
jgi:hypothetical protein